MKVCFVTLSRSDYTSLRPVIQEAMRDRGLDARVIAGGSHLLRRFGRSVEQIRKDGIKIHRTVDFLRERDDSDADLARAYGRAFPLFVKCFETESPDFVFILGDRWEMIAASTAASLLRIPIAHHSGGDLTQGSFDNQTRYLLTTQAHLHLVALAEHRKRLIAMGEEPWRVVHAGEPALVGVTERATGVDIRRELGLMRSAPFVLATFHPTPFDRKPLNEQVRVFLGALDRIDDEIVLTAPNPDPGSREFYRAISAYAKKKPNVHLFENLGARRYYAAMKAAKLMIGNSSSGIWEAPSFALPVVNLGDRQMDRVRAENVIDAPLNLGAIRKALDRAGSAKFRGSLKGLANPYVRRNTIELILDTLKKAPDAKTLLEKRLVDPLR